MKLLFDLGPKDKREELFGRDEEITEMTRLIVSGNWVAVLGPRMAGKTSLAKVTLDELRKKGYSTIYLNLRGTKSLHELLNKLAQSINANKSLVDKTKNFLSNIRVIHVGKDGFTLERDFSTPASSTLMSLFGALDRSSKKLIIALDEVQELASISGQLLALLSNIFTSYNNVKFVFTGSRIGLVESLLEPRDSESPLYGRPPAEVRLESFPREKSEAFILAGLKQFASGSADLDRVQVQEVVSRIDGVAGWLTMFGNLYAVRKVEFRKALERTVSEGGKITLSELKHFLEKRKGSNYMAMLRAIKDRGSLGCSWSEAKRGAEARLKRSLNNKTVTDSLEGLIQEEILKKTGNYYRIVDPLLQKAL